MLTRGGRRFGSCDDGAMANTLIPVEEYLGTSYPDGDREYVDAR